MLQEGRLNLYYPLQPSMADVKKIHIKLMLGQKPYSYTGVDLGIHAAIWEKYLYEMQKQDLVLIPDEEPIYLAKIESDYSCEPVEKAGQTTYLHLRQVTLVRTLKRYQLSPALRTALRVRRDVASLERHSEEIRTLAASNTGGAG